MREDPTTESVPDTLSTADSADERSELFELLLESANQQRDVEADLAALIEQIDAILPTEDVAFSDAIIKENLDDILLVLITLHGEAHGKELLSDLSQQLGVQLSPGTVYPSLHHLEDEEILSMQTKVRTKEYSINDEEAVRSMIEETMLQHLAFGMFLYAVLPRLS